MAQREELDPETSERLRQAVRAVMDGRGLRASPWAIEAGVSSGSLYAFLQGRSNHLSTPVLTKLAAAAKVPLSVLTGEGPAPEATVVDFVLKGDTITRAPRQRRRPAPLPPDMLPDDMRVAEVTTDTNSVLRLGTLVYWNHGPGLPANAVGRLSIVEIVNQPAFVLADVRPAFAEGAYLLVTASGRIIEEAKVASAWPLLWLRAP